MLLFGASALARPPDVYFEWQRPAASQCPSRTVLQDDVEALMGRPVFTSAAEARVIVRGIALDGPDGVAVRIEATDARGNALGTRELSAPAGQCPRLRDAIGLVLTLFVEYEEPSTDTLETVFGFGGEASLAQTPLPRFAFAVGPALYVAIGSTLRLHASGAYWLPVSIQTARGVGATLEAFSLELRGCARVWAGLGLCAGFEGGILSAEPLQLIGPEQQTRLLAHALLAASYEIELGGIVSLELAAGSMISVSRPEFFYRRSDGTRVDVYTPQAVGVIFQSTVIILGK